MKKKSYIFVFMILFCIINSNSNIGWKEIFQAKPLIVLPLAYTFISIPIIGSIIYYIYQYSNIIIHDSSNDSSDKEKLDSINSIDKKITELEKIYILYNKYYKNEIVNINNINENAKDLYLKVSFIIKNNDFLKLINDDQKKFIDEFTMKNNSIHKNDIVFIYKYKELILSLKDLSNNLKDFINKEDKRDAERLIKLNLKNSSFKFKIKESENYKNIYTDFEEFLNENKNIINEIIKIYIDKFGEKEINNFINKIKNESPEIDSLVIFQDKELLDNIKNNLNFINKSLIIFNASLGLTIGAIFVNSKYNNYKKRMKAANKEKEIGFFNFIKESTKNIFKRKK